MAVKVRTRVIPAEALQWTGNNSAEMREFMGISESWLDGDHFIAHMTCSPFLSAPQYGTRIRLNEVVVKIEGKALQYFSEEEFNERFEAV